MYPLYTGCSLKSKMASAQSQRNASSFDVTTNELETALAIKTAYYQADLSKKYAGVYQAREATEHLRLAKGAEAIRRHDQ